MFTMQFTGYQFKFIFFVLAVSSYSQYTYDFLQ